MLRIFPRGIVRRDKGRRALIEGRRLSNRLRRLDSRPLPYPLAFLDRVRARPDKSPRGVAGVARFGEREVIERAEPDRSFTFRFRRDIPQEP